MSKKNFVIAAEGIKRQVPASFGLFVDVDQAQKMIDFLERALRERKPESHCFWVSVHLNGDPLLFDGTPRGWND